MRGFILYAIGYSVVGGTLLALTKRALTADAAYRHADKWRTRLRRGGVRDCTWGGWSRVEAVDQAVRVEIDDIAARKPTFWYEPAKRVLDIAISSLLLAVFLPLLIPISLLILLDNPGPIFHRREVVGRNGRPFNALKLRTMIENGDHKVARDSSLAEEYHNNHKLRRDPRVTRIGRALRKTSLDEFPQLMNVLRGEMSLVGPRMISFPELRKFGPWQDRILEVKPGITGLWQVNGRSDLPYEERVRWNVHYVNNRSLLMDLRILAKTIPAVIGGRGAY